MSKIVKDLETYATLLQTSSYDILKAQKIDDPITKFCLYSVQKSKIKPGHQNLLFSFISDVKKDIYNVYPPLVDLIQSESTYYISFEVFNLLTDVTLSKGYKDNYLYNITKRKQYIEDLKRIGEYCDRKISPVNLVMDDSHIYCLPLYSGTKGNYKEDNRNLMLRMIYALVTGETLSEDRAKMSDTNKKLIKLLEDNYSNPHLDSIIHQNLEKDEEEIEFNDLGINNNLKNIAKSMDFRRSHKTESAGYDMNFDDDANPSMLDDDKIHKPKLQSGKVSTIIEDKNYPSIDSYKPFSGNEKGFGGYPEMSLNEKPKAGSYKSVYPTFGSGQNDAPKNNCGGNSYPTLNMPNTKPINQPQNILKNQYNLYPNSFLTQTKQQSRPISGGVPQQNQTNTTHYQKQQDERAYNQFSQGYQKQQQPTHGIQQEKKSQYSQSQNYPQFAETSLNLQKYGQPYVAAYQQQLQINRNPQLPKPQPPTISTNQYSIHNNEGYQPNISFKANEPQVRIPQILTNPQMAQQPPQPQSKHFSSKPPIQNRLTQNAKKDEINKILTSVTGFMSDVKPKLPTQIKRPQKKPSTFQPKSKHPSQQFEKALQGYLSQFKLYSRLIKSFLTYYVTTNLGRVASYLIARSCVQRKLRLINALIKGDDIFNIGSKNLQQVDIAKYVQKIQKTVYKEDPQQFKLLINFRSITPETYNILKPFLGEIDETDKTEDMCFFYLFTLSQRDPQRDVHHMMLYDAAYAISSKGFDEVYDYKELPREWDQEYANDRKEIIRLLAFRV